MAENLTNILGLQPLIIKYQSVSRVTEDRHYYYSRTLPGFVLTDETDVTGETAVTNEMLCQMRRL